MRDGDTNWIETVVLFILAIALCCGGIWAFELGWNFAVSPVFNVPNIDYAQAAVLAVMICVIKKI